MRLADLAPVVVAVERELALALLACAADRPRRARGVAGRENQDLGVIIEAVQDCRWMEP
jgi:hypothetical protein